MRDHMTNANAPSPVVGMIVVAIVGSIYGFLAGFIVGKVFF
jgi:hypothetical protein